MNKNELIKAVQRFFGDTSRSKAETREGLREAADLCENLIESIDDTDSLMSEPD